MTGVARGEREISAQHCPVSGMDRAASRTTPDTIFFGLARPVLHPLTWRAAEKNRARHRRWRGRFAVLDPARSIPGAPSCLLKIRRKSCLSNSTSKNCAPSFAALRTGRNCGRSKPNWQPRWRSATGSGERGTDRSRRRQEHPRRGSASAVLPFAMAVFRAFGAVEAEGARRARLKVDPVNGINALSAHPFFTRQGPEPERQGAAKFLIILIQPRDSLIVVRASIQPRPSFTDQHSGGAWR